MPSESMSQALLRLLGVQRLVEQIPDTLREQVQWAWGIHARPEQLPPEGDWTTWLLLAGRGFGKTRTGAEWVIRQAHSQPGQGGYLAARTVGDVRGVMVEGPSGILARSPPDFRPIYEPSKRRVTWPNGAWATTFSAEKPEQGAGHNHAWGWADELAKWGEWGLWHELQLTLRVGARPRQVVTTTPRPVRVIREMLADPTCHPTRGTTYDNRANLAPAFFSKIIQRYEGTRLGRQELEAVVLDDVPGALWSREVLRSHRLIEVPYRLERIVVGVDPAVSNGSGSNWTGIVAVGLGRTEAPGMRSPVAHGFVLADRSCRKSPDGWAREAVALAHNLGATTIVAEKNQGGDLVEALIRSVDATIGYEGVHSKVGKKLRAEPVAALYEQGRVHHIGVHEDLEDQMCQWDGSPPEDEPEEGAEDEEESTSPDRLDALVHGLTYLFGDEWLVPEQPATSRWETPEQKHRRERMEELAEAKRRTYHAQPRGGGDGWATRRR